jgi:hypothetical protein
MSTTQTDKPGFKTNLIDKSTFNSLDQDQKELFELLRNSMLEIFPIENGVDELCEKCAENYAFIGVKAISKYLNKFKELLLKDIDIKINTTETNLKQYITTSASASTNSSKGGF